MSVVNGMLEADIACLPQGTFYSSIITSSLRNSYIVASKFDFHKLMPLLRNSYITT